MEMECVAGAGNGLINRFHPPFSHFHPLFHPGISNNNLGMNNLKFHPINQPVTPKPHFWPIFSQKMPFFA